MMTIMDTCLIALSVLYCMYDIHLRSKKDDNHDDYRGHVSYRILRIVCMTHAWSEIKTIIMMTIVNIWRIILHFVCMNHAWGEIKAIIKMIVMDACCIAFYFVSLFIPYLRWKKDDNQDDDHGRVPILDFILYSMYDPRLRWNIMTTIVNACCIAFYFLLYVWPHTWGERKTIIRMTSWMHFISHLFILYRMYDQHLRWTKDDDHDNDAGRLILYFIFFIGLTHASNEIKIIIVMTIMNKCHIVLCFVCMIHAWGEIKTIITTIIVDKCHTAFYFVSYLWTHIWGEHDKHDGDRRRVILHFILYSMYNPLARWYKKDNHNNDRGQVSYCTLCWKVKLFNIIDVISNLGNIYMALKDGYKVTWSF